MQRARKTSDEKKGITFQKQEMHPSKCKGLKRTPLKKEASCFMNKNAPFKIQVAQKTSDESPKTKNQTKLLACRGHNLCQPDGQR
jgi:hypothetical protein